MITVNNIDNGQPFDWGKTSADYAQFRDIYPQEFYNRIKALGLAESGFRVLDIGTGTGVLPRALYSTGAEFVGTDLSAEQIEQAKCLAEKAGMSLEFIQGGAEQMMFPDNSFDSAMACQCYWYFNHPQVAETLYKQLKPQGVFAIMTMNWLPFEDEIAAESERIILKHNPNWSGNGFKRELISLPEAYLNRFTLIHSEEFSLNVPFTRESWHGRIRACRGVGAVLSGERLAEFEHNHRGMLSRYPEKFNILHSGAIAVLKSKKEK